MSPVETPRVCASARISRTTPTQLAAIVAVSLVRVGNPDPIGQLEGKIRVVRNLCADSRAGPGRREEPSAPYQNRKDRKPKNRPRSVQEILPSERTPAVVRTAIAKQMQATRIRIDLLLLNIPLRAMKVSSVEFGSPAKLRARR
jgi:hypothetical protein